MRGSTRREFLVQGGAAVAAAATSVAAATAGRAAGTPARRQWAPPQVLHPRNRVPLSFVIDDSTCLVNMGHFCTPQFAAAFPNRAEYQRPWQDWPREIPDAFVREFGEWCADQGVRGKYSVVPNPACVGWLDRELPGWSARALQDSLNLVRDLMVPNWDIHPEMITHTRVIDPATGRPLPEVGPATIENSWPPDKRSVDELAEYMAYALRILRNCGLPCEGITTPGGFGNRVKSELSLAVGEAVRDVFSVEIPHYFKYVHTGDEGTQPVLEHLTTSDDGPPRFTVNVPAGTGDWFGGWQGVSTVEGERYCDESADSGRMVELIRRGEPAVMLCHWPGMYCNGQQTGFREFQRIVRALQDRFGDETQWMKLSEIARYQAARELTQITAAESSIILQAPYSVPDFTLRIPHAMDAPPQLVHEGQPQPLQEVRAPRDLAAGTWRRSADATDICFDLPRGRSELRLSGE